MIELITQCPQCQSRFDVTLEQLQKRKGLLRCAECAHIFDAYECAVDAHYTSPPPSIKTVKTTTVTPTVNIDFPHFRKQFIGDFPLSLGVGVPPAVTTRAQMGRTIKSPQPIQRAEASPSDSDIRVYLDQADRLLKPNVTEPVLTGATDGIRFTPEPRQTHYPTITSSFSWIQSLWWLLFWVLLFTLMAQLVYVYRAQIANTVSFTRPVLQLMCDVTGCDIPYMREIQAIDITHSSLQQQPVGIHNNRYAYNLQLQLKNNLAWAQEWPTLVVSFSDAAAATMATVAVTPDQYLSPNQLQRPFAAGEQYTVRLPVSLGNKKINGFTVEKYYP